MNIKEKLWIAYWVLAISTIGIALMTQSFPISMGFAVAAAACGWTAFFLS